MGKYQETAAYCHFGREPHTKDGIKFFEWENAKDLSKFKQMTSAQVTAELKSSNYLTKWVDLVPAKCCCRYFAHVLLSRSSCQGAAALGEAQAGAGHLTVSLD